MWAYEKRLQYPVNIKNTNAKYAKIIMSQYGGPNGEIGASLRYLSQKYSMPFKEVRDLLNDIGTEELAHLEIVGSIVTSLTKNLTPEQVKEQGFEDYYTEHTLGVYPQGSGGTPFSAAGFQSIGDAIADLSEDMAAEQKARVTYDNILSLVDEPDIRDVIKFLREREIVHYQRFGEALELVKEKLNSKNFYAFNPETPLGRQSIS